MKTHLPLVAIIGRVNVGKSTLLNRLSEQHKAIVSPHPGTTRDLIQAEINWNAFRLANLARSKGDAVSIFLIAEGVEYGKHTSDQFNIKKLVEKFLESGGTIVACGTCMAIRKQKSVKECPAGGIEDLYHLIADSDKMITF